jgi:glycosyltransferase involved in cell wall biosynthesis
MLLLSCGLRDAGHRVVFCVPPEGILYKAARDVGLETRGLPTGNFLMQWRSSRLLRRIAREVGAEVVHAHHTKGHNVVLLATIGGGFPPVIVKRGVMYKPQSGALKYNTRRVRAVAALTDGIKGVLVGSGVRADKIGVLRHAVELPALDVLEAAAPALRSELGLDGCGPVVGSVGNARPEKGFHLLVEAAPRILASFPETVFVLVGAGGEKLVPQLEALGIRDKFRLPGHRRDVSAIVNLFDVFVFPGEGMDSVPNVLLEAMAVGKPVVGTDVAGMREPLGEDGSYGRLFPPGDSAALAQVLVDLLSDPEAARELGRQSRERMAAMYRLEDRVQEALDLYRNVQEEGR